MATEEESRTPSSRRRWAKGLWGGSFLGWLAIAAAGAQSTLIDGLRGPVPLEREPVPPPLARQNPMAPPPRRDYPMQPPVIPHLIDNYQVDLRVNTCMRCHARRGMKEARAPMVSPSHYQDRDGNFLAEISPRRYFCLQCHVVQLDVHPPVANAYKDVKALISRMQRRKPPAPKTVTVQPGDTLSRIAKRSYGDPAQWRRIYEANRDRIEDPDKIIVGMELLLAPLPETSIQSE